MKGIIATASKDLSFKLDQSGNKIHKDYWNSVLLLQSTIKNGDRVTPSLILCQKENQSEIILFPSHLFFLFKVN